MKEADRLYAEATRRLLYAAFIVLAAALVTHLALSPDALTQLEKAVRGEVSSWAPERFSDHLVMYAIYFINLVVPIGLVYILPTLYRENKAAVALTVFILVLLILEILGVLRA
jgi:cytochrome bd-type quinol oxidase subunit 2